MPAGVENINKSPKAMVMNEQQYLPAERKTTPTANATGILYTIKTAAIKKMSLCCLKVPITRPSMKPSRTITIANMRRDGTDISYGAVIRLGGGLSSFISASSISSYTSFPSSSIYLIYWSTSAACSSSCIGFALL